MSNNIYKLLGYKRINKETENGKYDFYELYCQHSKLEISPNEGGIQFLYTYKKGKGNKFPCVSVSNFDDCVKNGLKVNGNVSFYRDDSYHLCMKVEE